jgi:hypothetical protein
VAVSRSPEAPYSVSLAEAIAGAVTAVDSSSVNFTVTGNSVDGYVITAVVLPDVVTPAANPTLDIVGAKVNAPISYDTGTREFGLALSSDAGNALALGADDGLWVGSWLTGVVSSTAPLQVNLDGGALGVAAAALPSYTPVLADPVALLARGGPDNVYLVLGLAPA